MRILALLTALTATADAFAPCSRTTSSCNGNSMLGTVAARKMNSAPHVSTRGSASMLSLANPFLVAESAVAATTSSSTTEAMSPLMSHFLESLITNGVPALFSVIVIGFAALMLGKARKAQQEDVLQTRNPVSQLYEDLYGDQDPDGGMMGNNNKRGFWGRPPNDKMRLPSNAGVPALQYIKLTHLNRQWESYAYSLTAATQSKASAAADYRATSFRRALGMALGGPVRQELLTAEAVFLKTAGALSSQIVGAQARLTQHAVDEELEALGLTNVYDLDPAWNATAAANETSAVSNKKKKKKSKSKFNANEQFSQLSKWQRELQEVELDFIQDVIQAVGPANGAAVRAALLGDVAVRGSGGLLSALQDRPLRTLLMDAETGDSPKPGNVYVSRFPGDATASQVATLREEVTAIVQSAKPGDEALVILQTGGGTVTGYGLAAAQLMRFKDAGLKLTIAVEQVAASGGYMMACVADRIVASPFAVLGSIGVISDIPNVYERLKKEGIEFQTVTAGKYKRTLTPTKKVSKDDFDKSKADVEEILVLFRDFVAENRPELDIENVATGETWFGTAALERKLCDEIKTVDDVLLEYVAGGYDVYEVEYSPPVESPFGKLLLGTVSTQTEDSSWLRSGVRWVVRTIASEVQAELSSSTGLQQSRPIEQRYMVQDDASSRIKSD